MEQGLRDCCRSIRIGKILIHTDEETHDAKVVYAKLPPDIDNRFNYFNHVLLQVRLWSRA